jgi:Tat protein translocase TatB subunit
MPQIGPAEILVILLVGLLVFGPKRLPEIGRQVGRAMREVRKFQDTVKGELDDVLHFQDDDPEPASDAQPAVTAAEAPPALPPAGTDPAPPVTARPPSHAPSRFRTPSPAAAASNGAPAPSPSSPPPGPNRPPSRAPSRFRAPGPRPTA